MKIDVLIIYDRQKIAPNYCAVQIFRKFYFLIEFGAWEDMDLSLDLGKVAPVQLVASSTILAKFPNSDPRLPMLQIAKERYCRVQLTELYKMRPEPKKGAH